MKDKKNICIEEWEIKKQGYKRYLEEIEEKIRKKDYITVLECVNNEMVARNEKGYLIVKRNRANKNGYCTNKYCPVCREIKQKEEKEKIIKRLEEYKGQRLFILTISMKRGVKAEEIEEQIKRNNESFKILVDKAYKPMGYIKTVEVVEIKNKYNCHIHSILIYKKGEKVKPLKMLIDFIIKKNNNNYSIDFQEIKGKNGIEKVINYITVSEKKKIHNLDKKVLIGEIEKIKSTSHKYTYGGVLSSRKRGSK